MERWPGVELRDPYDENIYQVSGFATRLRESSLAPEPEDGTPADVPPPAAL